MENFKETAEQVSAARGVYIVSETGALNPTSGAGLHIRVGMEQLSKSFEMEMVCFCKPFVPAESRPNTHAMKRRNALIKFLSWLRLLAANHVSFFRYYRMVREKRPSFIYERAAYLNYNGLLIAKFLRVPHFYEVNGISSRDHKKFFPAICTKLSFALEKWSYNRSNLGFYVGGINRHFNLSESRSMVIQNGVDQSFVEKFSGRINVPADKINVAFVGHAMDHHRLDVLIESLNRLKRPSSFRMHFVGPGLEVLKNQISADVESIFYGQKDVAAIAKLMQGFNVGVITFAYDYSSHVKLFMYGAAKLLTLLPETINFQSIFSPDEVMFIRNGDAVDIAAKLDAIAEDLSIIESRGERVYKKVTDNFTWEKVYAGVSSKITEQLSSRKYESADVAWKS